MGDGTEPNVELHSRVMNALRLIRSGEIYIEDVAEEIVQEIKRIENIRLKSEDKLGDKLLSTQEKKYKYGKQILIDVILVKKEDHQYAVHLLTSNGVDTFYGTGV